MTQENPRISKAMELIAQLSVDRASQVLSKMVKTGARITLEKAYIANISEITSKINLEDREVMGAFVDLLGDAPFKFLFYADAESALILTDLILRRPVGTTKNFDIYVESAIQEIGNVLASSVCNVFATDFQINMKPSPPFVVHDYVGTMFEEYIVNVASERNEILIIESKFVIVTQNIGCNMFVLPSEGSEKILSSICNMV